MELSGSLPKSISSELQTLCNKSTCFYWKQTDERDDAYLPSYVFGAIWKEWFRCHKGDPTIDYGHFFGRSIRITPTGPSTVTGIVLAHCAMCDQASSILDGLSSGEIKQELPYFLPDIQNYKLLPLLQAIIVIFEELIPDSAIPIGADGKISLDRFLQLQTVLLVQTGNESGLNSPISFQDLEPASALTSILPTKAEEVHNTTQIRVPLGTAVKFIADLQEREEPPPKLNIRLAGSSLGDKLDKYEDRDILSQVINKEVFAEAYMRIAQRKGVDSEEETWNAIRRIEATRRGEIVAYIGLCSYEFSRGWA